jgi:hypothetical protein
LTKSALTLKLSEIFGGKAKSWQHRTLSNTNESNGIIARKKSLLFINNMKRDFSRDFSGTRKKAVKERSAIFKHPKALYIEMYVKIWFNAFTTCY